MNNNNDPCPQIVSAVEDSEHGSVGWFYSALIEVLMEESYCELAELLSLLAYLCILKTWTIHYTPNLSWSLVASDSLLMASHHYSGFETVHNVVVMGSGRVIKH